jgi:dTDP-4-amino-4,6-dideoxygalactose transaminase
VSEVHERVGHSGATIPLFKVAMTPAAIAAAQTTLLSGHIGQGPQVDEFERRLGEWVAPGAQVVSVNSGTSALDLAFELLGLGVGDRVITSPMTCAATNTMLLRRGCEIVWADCDARTGLVDPASVESLVDGRTRAIVVVDWAGELCDVARLSALGVPIVQDAAHSLAGLRVWDTSRATADFVCWSFQAIKHLTTADGGALVLRDPQLASTARLLRWFGLDRSIKDGTRALQDLERPGFRYTMNDLAASIGIANLDQVGANIEMAQRNAAIYDDQFCELRTAPPSGPSSRWLYVIHVRDCGQFIKNLASRGIEAAKVHRRNDSLSCFSAFRRRMPGLDEFYPSYVSIPVGWWLSDGDLERVVETVLADPLVRW